MNTYCLIVLLWSEYGRVLRTSVWACTCVQLQVQVNSVAKNV